MNYQRVTFGSLEVGQWFKYQNKRFRKTRLVDMGSCIYNAITEEVFGSAFIVCLDDKKMVRAEMPKGMQS